jgi:hypothetical protein
VINVSSEFFDTLRVHPHLGRWFSRADEVRVSNTVVILTDSVWRRRFSADPNVIGRDIKLADGSAVVVGVALARGGSRITLCFCRWVGSQDRPARCASNRLMADVLST